MDGNRRYASKQNVNKAVGHTRGFDKLAETLLWCREMGVREVTVYAFSIENFKRSEEEVETLMQLAKEKYAKILEEKDKLHENGVCIRVIGNLNLIPKDLRKSIAQAVLMTKDNNKSFLNVAFAYTSRDEITNSMQTIATSDLDAEEIDSDLISSCMYSSESERPDILIRSSGEVRFSDFLLWQIWNTNVIFTDVLWPDFSVWHFFACIFQYQRCYKNMQLVGESLEKEPKGGKTMAGLEERRLKQLEIYAS